MAVLAGGDFTVIKGGIILGSAIFNGGRLGLVTLDNGCGRLLTATDSPTGLGNQLKGSFAGREIRQA